MKTFIAVLVTAAIVGGGAHAYDAAVTPAQVADLQGRVTALESFRRKCLRHINLYENSDGVMAWGVGPPTPHAGVFYGIPATATPHLGC